MSNNIGEVIKTGHMYYGTSMQDYESVDNCGTCDGARCDICKTKYKVEDENENRLYYGEDRDKAVEIAGYDFAKYAK